MFVIANTRDEAIAAWNRRAAVTDYDFSMAVHDGNLWGKCSECKERKGHYLDAETIQRQQERIAELEAQLEGRVREMAAGALEAQAGIMQRMLADMAARDELIRNLYRMVNCACLTDKLHCIGCEMLGEGAPCDLTKMHRRICDMGIEVDE